ncbi:MAG: serine/threonine protein kinase, partial [bacterium]|nr:serine/threonine protein kinase [bacterium]
MSHPDADTAIGRLFDAASELPKTERSAWLDERCEDAEQRRRVEELLTRLENSSLEATPETIGDYRILAVIGRGGMGMVYLAEQTHPRRRVAIKLLRPDLFSTRYAYRFECEAELLGKLQHRGIARIYEFSREDEGQGGSAFIVMEYVEGRSLTAFANAQGASLDQRLELLEQLATAVHHAHLRGVVHRDLKPANVLVTGEGEVKVID